MCLLLFTLNQLTIKHIKIWLPNAYIYQELKNHACLFSKLPMVSLIEVDASHNHMKKDRACDMFLV